jgi:anti-sigma28 factor (negative regulator of flagellin synthesis)
MHINTRVSGAINTVTPVDKAEARPQGAAADSTSAAPATDSVQISDAGRARAAGSDSVSGLDPDRVAQIRQNILTGAYNSLDVVDKVASRILDSGDL